MEALARAARDRFHQSDPLFLLYGLEQGDGYFRLSLARFLSQNYHLPTDPESLFITNGVSSALNLLCTSFTQAGDTIFVEEPTYFLGRKIFADHHLTPVALPMDADGLMVDALEEELKRTRPAFLYTIPTYHNPTQLSRLHVGGSHPDRGGK